jgi:hypothetical protein
VSHLRQLDEFRTRHLRDEFASRRRRANTIGCSVQRYPFHGKILRRQHIQRLGVRVLREANAVAATQGFPKIHLDAESQRYSTRERAIGRLRQHRVRHRRAR